MNYLNKPHFIIKSNLQKSAKTGVYFSDVITERVMQDICQRLTGISSFTYQYVDNDYEDEFIPKGYNRGRMAVMQYHDTIYYISFSESHIGGRNSSVQSVPTIYNLFYMNPYPNKHLCYYFLDYNGNASTEYQLLMYRLMKTVGFRFLNIPESLGRDIAAFSTIDDILHLRKANADRNRGNNSTYITKSGVNQFDIYGKTYGANKYETSMICYAASTLSSARQQITLYEMAEGNLVELPSSSLAVLKKTGNITVIATDMQLEQREFVGHNSLRSPRYIFNLLEHLGPKRCALCNCEIPEIIQGAHIWPVSEIKRAQHLSLDAQIAHATSGENGLWLCENHHKLFDSGLITIRPDGNIVLRNGLDRKATAFIDEITPYKSLPDQIMTSSFVHYLDLRFRLLAG